MCRIGRGGKCLTIKGTKHLNDHSSPGMLPVSVFNRYMRTKISTLNGTNAETKTKCLQKQNLILNKKEFKDQSTL